MRTLLLVSAIAVIALSAEQSSMAVPIAPGISDLSLNEQSRNGLLTAEERLDIETRSAYVESRVLTR